MNLTNTNDETIKVKFLNEDGNIYIRNVHWLEIHFKYFYIDIKRNYKQITLFDNNEKVIYIIQTNFIIKTESDYILKVINTCLDEHAANIIDIVYRSISKSVLETKQAHDRQLKEKQEFESQYSKELLLI